MGKLTVFALSLVCASAAWADKTTEEAKLHFKRGADFYDEGNYRAALIEFERTHQLTPNYKILYNIGQVHLELLEYSKAQEAFTRYLKEGGSDVSGTRRDEVNRELDKLKTRVGRIVVTTTEGAEVLLDDESVGQAPLPGPVSANTGRHTITVQVPGKAAQSRVIDLAGLDTVTVKLGLQEQLTPSADASRAGGASAVVTSTGPTVHSKGPMIAGWVVTGVLTITAASLAGVAFSSAADLSKLKATLGVTQASLNASANKVGTFSAVADILGLAAIVSGGISLWLTISALSTDDVAVSIGPTGGSVYVRF